MGCCMMCVSVCVHVCVCVFVCRYRTTRRQRHLHACTRLNASLGNCLNGIRGTMVPVWGWDCGNDMGKHTHVAFTAPTATLSVDPKCMRCVVTGYFTNTPQGCKCFAKKLAKKLNKPFFFMKMCILCIIHHWN